MLDIRSVNHIGIRVGEKSRSVSFYQDLGFEQLQDAGFEEGHPVIMRHPSGVVLNLLGPANVTPISNVLMDVPEKHAGYTHIALTIASLSGAEKFMRDRSIEITGSFSFGEMSAIFIRDPDRNVIELDAYGELDEYGTKGYAGHPS
jgi:lactoylglutathione lyase